MILQKLVKHYELLAREKKVAVPGWCEAKVSYCLNLNPEGELEDIVSVKTMQLRGKKEVLAPSLWTVPEMVKRTSGVSANFLCDNSKYILGIDKEGWSERTQQCFDAARARHCDILSRADSDRARAIIRFFQTWKPEKASDHEKLGEKWDEVTDGGNLIFRVKRKYAQEDDAICGVWQEEAERQDEGNGLPGRCLVTGRQTRIARIHNDIRGVQGAQSSGAALISFNAPAFESYGKEQSFNAPVGDYAMYAYTTALNYLLSRRDYVFLLGDTTVVFWADNGVEEYQKAFLYTMQPGGDNQREIKRIFELVQKGKPIDIEGIELDPDQHFCILGLAPNAARLSVRFFYEDSFGKILENINRHYRDMEIIRPAYDGREYLSTWAMMMETVNEKSRDKKPQPGIAAGTVGAILSGGKYPESLYENVLIRLRAETDKAKREKAAIIKAYQIRNRGRQGEKEGTSVELNENCRDIAYVLGREFAILEKIQTESVRTTGGTLNTTIKDRYFNSACATPALVFPILFKLKENHIRKLSTGAKIYFETMLGQLQSYIPATEGQRVPYKKRLTLEEQGMFILGYYHQVQKMFEKKEDK